MAFLFFFKKLFIFHQPYLFSVKEYVRQPCKATVAVPPGSVAWAAAVMDQPSEAGGAPWSFRSGCWQATRPPVPTDPVPADPSATWGWVEINPGPGVIHSLWNSSWVSALSVPPAPPFQSLRDPWWNRDRTWPHTSVHPSRILTSAESPGRRGHIRPQELPSCCSGGRFHTAQGRVCVTWRNSRRVTVRRLCKTVRPSYRLGSVSTADRAEAACIRLVMLTGVDEAPHSGGSSRGSSKLTQLGWMASIPGARDSGISWVFNVSKGMSCQQKLLPGSLRIHKVMPSLFLL